MSGGEGAGNPRWFDHHCHLEPGGEAAAAVEAAAAAGVERLVCVGTDEERTAQAVAVARAHPGVVWATAGAHPHEARHGWGWVEAALVQPEVLAVGECGLDYHYDFSPRDAQQAGFAAQVELANRAGLPLVIHTREAWEDTFAILGEVGTPARTVFHCFTGGAAEARRCLDLGAWLSFSGIVTFKGASDVREAAALCPLDRLLVETDAPYLAPVPHRGRPNQPAWVPFVGAAVATIKAVDEATVADATWRGAHAFYGLPCG